MDLKNDKTKRFTINKKTCMDNGHLYTEFQCGISFLVGNETKNHEKDNVIFIAICQFYTVHLRKSITPLDSCNRTNPDGRNYI